MMPSIYLIDEDCNASCEKLSWYFVQVEKGAAADGQMHYVLSVCEFVEATPH